jgi:hypothetical protein
MTLTTGYTATSTDPFTITGTTPVKVTKLSGDDHITWNNSTRRLDIAAGLPAGVYEVKLQATNSASSNHTFTFTLTVAEPVYYIENSAVAGGAVTVKTGTDNPYLATEGATVTLTITPDTGYELESVHAFKMDNPTIAIPLSGNGLIRTFTMPAYHVTIVAAFSDTRTTAAENIQPAALTAYVQNGVLYITGLTAGQTWSVYNLSGILIYRDTAAADRASIPLPCRGIYLVTSGNRTVKVTN